MPADHLLVLRLATLLAALAWMGSAQAQLSSGPSDPWSPRPAAGSDRLGLHPAGAQVAIGCGASLLPCRTEAAALQAREPSGFRWNLELSQLRLGATDVLLPGPGQDAVNLSLVGRQPLWGSRFSVYGKLGTTYAHAEPMTGLAAGSPTGPDGYGVSFGAGVSMAVTRRLSATVGWDSHELRLGGGGREAVSAVGLGLQYRY